MFSHRSQPFSLRMILRKLHSVINEDVVRILDCYVKHNVENGLNFKYFK